MDDELNALKPTYAPESFYKWNVKDLNDYKEKLKAEIDRIDEALATKQGVSAQAEALFKSGFKQGFCLCADTLFCCQSFVNPVNFSFQLFFIVIQILNIPFVKRFWCISRFQCIKFIIHLSSPFTI